MVVVGLGLTRQDFRRVAKHPVLVIAAIAGQWLLLPVASWVLILCLPLPPAIAVGVALLASCPAGVISTYYSLIARGDVALSTTLTAISIAVGTAKMPLISTISFRLFLDETTRIGVPVVPMVIQLLLFLVLPTVIGMWFRERNLDFVLRHMKAARRVGDVAIVICSIVIFVGLRGFVVAELGWVVAAAIAFSVLAIGTGLAMAVLVRADHRQMRTIGIEFSCRNNAIMALVGLAVLDRPELAAFALVVFLVQIPVVLGGFVAIRSRVPARALDASRLDGRGG
ncbi:MAG: hypothetical protein EP299_00890 [Acidobacteria bacterium]|nr:MAG: hypothetical protein EP299_00890 [Acidobacteriota bacterium]